MRAAAVPLKCGKGGLCEAVVEEEKVFQKEVNISVPFFELKFLMTKKVSWGTLRIQSGREGEQMSCDFLTSNYGGYLPTEPLSVYVANPPHACQPLDVEKTGGLANGSAVLVRRGNCQFGQKSLNAQSASAAVVIVTDSDDPALQRPGSVHPIAGYVSIPSILIPWPCAREIIKSIEHASSCVSVEGTVGACNENVVITLHPGQGSERTNDWINIALTEFMDNPEELETQIMGLLENYAGKEDISSWLRRKINTM
jgi:hypothetical protein